MSKDNAQKVQYGRFSFQQKRLHKRKKKKKKMKNMDAVWDQECPPQNVETFQNTVEPESKVSLSLSRSHLQQKIPGQHFGPGRMDLKHLDLQAFMVPTPHVDKKGGQVMSQKSSIEFQNRIPKDHTHHPKGYHNPKLVGFTVMKSFQSTHIGPYKMNC